MGSGRLLAIATCSCSSDRQMHPITPLGAGLQPSRKNKEVAMVTLKNELVEFAFYRPDAQDVQLAGDFNDWQPGQLPMVPSDDGYWTARIPLPAGEFKFRYWADGQWFTDFAAFGVEPGVFGLDSVVRVPHPPLKVAQPGPIAEAAAA